jgi:hypothetical protein
VITVDLLRQILALLEADPALAAAVGRELGPEWVADTLKTGIPKTPVIDPEQVAKAGVAEITKLTDRIAEINDRLDKIAAADAQRALASYGRAVYRNGALHQ